jgi:hypothetical protein
MIRITTRRPGFTVGRVGGRVTLSVRADGDEVVSIEFEPATADMIGEALRCTARGDGASGTGARNVAGELLEACRAMALELQHRRDMLGGLTGAELDALSLGQQSIRAAEGEGGGA